MVGNVFKRKKRINYFNSPGEYRNPFSSNYLHFVCSFYNQQNNVIPLAN